MPLAESGRWVPVLQTFPVLGVLRDGRVFRKGPVLLHATQFNSSGRSSAAGVPDRTIVRPQNSPTMTTDEDLYREAVSHALAGFQLIEASLKDYIEAFHEVVRKHLPASITYLHGRADIEDASLGRLVGAFSRINGNAELIGKLRGLQRKRDELAHRALTKLYGQGRESFDFAGNTDPLVELANDLGYLLEEVQQEGLKLVVAGRIVVPVPRTAAD